MRKDKKPVRKKQAKNLVILCEQPKVIIMGWQSCLYRKFPNLDEDLRARVHFLYILNCDVQRPKWLTHLEDRVICPHLSLFLSLISLPFHPSYPALCCILSHLRAMALELLFASNSLFLMCLHGSLSLLPETSVRM